ncbi:hypothetical protein [Actinocorallia libanotica]|uniref:PH (Pleckstrin Homology) domain-containing protein n=1 Tax=Actinocorallia libanotica TaxID=46162 RepID=A0ABP4BAH4_9ACTN
MTTEETAPEDTVTQDAPAEEEGEFGQDVLEAGAGLGAPVPDEPDPRQRTLKLLIGICLLGVLAAGTAAAFAPTLHPGLAAAWALLVLALLAVAGLRFAELRKLAEPSVALFSGGFVHAGDDGLEAVSWPEVELAYLTPGKRLILQLEGGRSFELRAPVRNLERLERAVRAGVPRDQIRRGTPPKPLAAV